MDPRVVIGTAGHIDHGKTALVKALTGVDTDRLAEEKARGITIELGFAPLALPGVEASVVDVPGHEGFVRTMVAGATGVDLALLVVAADEGVMPQTREHVAVLRFLGVRRGVVALTKTDLAPDPEWRALVGDDVRELVTREMGATWPVVEVSPVAGSGLDDLRGALAAAAAQVGSRPVDDRFRLPVDRVFALPGAGLIVTGTVWSGQVEEGARVEMLPAGAQGRVRSIQVHGEAARLAIPGRRAALAVVGPTREDAARGAVVVTGEGWRTSRGFDAEVTLLAGVSLRPRLRLRVDHGTAEVLGRVAAVAGSGTVGALVRLHLEEPLVLRAGDRFVLRSYSPVTTIGGGVVTDPWVDAADRARRRAPLAPVPRSERDLVAGLVKRRGAGGMSVSAIEVAAGLARSVVAGALAGAADLGLAAGEDWYVANDEVASAAGDMERALDRFHLEHPLEPGMSAQAWRGVVRGPAALAELAAARLADAGTVAREGALVRRPGFDPSASREAQAGQERVLAALEAAGAEPPSTAELQSRFPGLDVPALLRMLARSGRAVAVQPDRYYGTGALKLERERLVSLLMELGSATPAVLRDRTGRSRKWLIPLLEWMDREGVTIRNGDERKLHPATGA